LFYVHIFVLFLALFSVFIFQITYLFMIRKIASFFLSFQQKIKNRTAAQISVRDFVQREYKLWKLPHFPYKVTDKPRNTPCKSPVLFELVKTAGDFLYKMLKNGVQMLLLV